ncbi:hypothetical protein SASPL_102194 [Salvia splendens]|uniref:Pentatricopeptide repeat-containing protein n=1 Tax=Salvia splendens TaxID=180675 RepID=A0A8X8YVV4_SALSN|nr:hypothetical protein SASPL_102194 [Salvia splendens]
MVDWRGCYLLSGDRLKEKEQLKIANWMDTTGYCKVISEVCIPTDSETDNGDEDITLATDHVKTARKLILATRRNQDIATAKRFNLRINEIIAEDEGGAANVCATRGRELMPPPHSRCEDFGALCCFSLLSPPSDIKPALSDALLTVYGKAKLPNEAAELTLGIFAEAMDCGVWMDKFSYGKAIQSAVKLGDLDKGFELMNLMKKRGIMANRFVYNVLIGGLCRERRVNDAENLFDEMSQLNISPNRVAYNSLIDGYCKVGDIDKAFDMIERMKCDNVETNLMTYNTLLWRLRRFWMICVPTASCQMDLLIVFSLMGTLGVLKEHGVVITIVILNTTIKGYCKVGNLDNAVLAVDGLEREGVTPSCVTYNTMINHFCELGRMEEAHEWVGRMKAKGLSPVVRTFNILIDGYGRVCQFEKCLQILDEMESDGLKPNVVTFGSLINSFCKKERILEAEVILKDMLKRGVLPNVQIYNMLISGHCMGGNTENAFKLFDEMSRNGVSPTIVTYNVLINGLCKIGKTPEAEELAFTIANNGLSLIPDVITFNSLISGFSDAGNADKCLKLFERMKESGLKPTLRTYYPLISVLKKEGLDLVEKMSQLELAPDQVA